MRRRPAFLSSPYAFPSLMGAFGVAMGFAAFVLIREEGKTPVVFLTGLFAAAVTSYVIEAVREHAEGAGHAARPEPGRVLGLLVLLGIFEIFVSGVEKSVALVSAGEAAAFLDQVFVHGITRDVGAVAQLLLFAGLWIVLGGAAAWSVMSGSTPTSPPDATPNQWKRVTAPARRIGVGMALVAAIALAYVLVTRLAVTIWVLLTRPQDYQPGFITLLDASPSGAGAAMAQFAILLAAGLEWLAGTGRWGGVLLLAAVALLVALARPVLASTSEGFGRRIALITLLGALMLLALGPFATSGEQFARLVRIVVASTLIWLVPLTVLTVARPRLGRSVESPRVWGIVSFVVALALVAITWDRLSQPPVPMYVATLVVALVVTSWLFWRGADVVRFWPLVALTLAIAAFEGSSLLQRLTFLTTFKEAALLQAAPLRGGDEAVARRGYAAIGQWRDDSLLDAASATLVERVRTLPGDTAVAAIDALLDRVASALDSTYFRAVDAACRPSGAAVLDSLHADVVASCTLSRDFTVAAHRDTAVAGRWQAVWDSLWANVRQGSGRMTLDRLLAGGGESLQGAWYRVRWDDTTSDDMRGAVASARVRLPDELQAASPEEAVHRALRDSTLADSVRGWALLYAFAVSAPPSDAVRGWGDDLESLERRPDGRARDFPLSMVGLWQVQRHRRLADLFEARHQGEVPAVAPSPILRQAGRRPSRQQLHRVRALAFAYRQLQLQRTRRSSDDGFAADTGAMVALELSLGASFAFWATAGLLAGLARRGADGADGADGAVEGARE